MKRARRGFRLPPLFPPGFTVREAREWIRKRILANQRDAIECPCCTQLVKVYKRPLNAAMARALICIHKYFQQATASEWLHVPDYLGSFRRGRRWAGGDVAKLRFWGLLIPMSGERDDGSPRNGFYKISALGIAFVENRKLVPKFAFLCVSEFLGLSDGGFAPEKYTTIHEALRDEFDYSELMEMEEDLS